MKKVAVQCRHVRLSFGATEVLKDVNLDIEPGEFFALLALRARARAPCCA